MLFRSPQANRRKKSDEGCSNSKKEEREEDEEHRHLISPVLNRRTVASSLLPTFLSSSHATGSGNTTTGSSSNTAIPAPTCHPFLMGGQYYPGKDKRLKLKRRKNSSRRVVHVLIMGCILVFSAVIVIWILVQSFDYYAHAYHHHDILSEWQPQSSSYSLSSMDRWYMHMWPAIRLERLQDPEDRRHTNMEQIAHGWFHRNDPPRTIPPRHKNKINSNNVINNNNRQLPEATENKDALEKSGNSDVIHPLNSSLSPTSTHHSPQWTVTTMDMTHRPQCLSETAVTQQSAVTLVTQTTLDRLPLLQLTCKRWTDPLVVVIALPATQNSDNWTPPEWWKTHCAHAQILPFVQPREPSEYPVNFYRNVGLEAVSTSHVLVLDVDLIPSTELVFILHAQLQAQQKKATLASPTALIVPAWERRVETPCATLEACLELSQRDTAFVPDSFSSLQKCVADKHCQVFQQDINWEGHGATHSHEWLDRSNQDHSATPTSLPCFDSLRYEPYIVLPWCQSWVQPSAPFYDERFVGYGKNKIEYLQHVRLLGYAFAIVPTGFVVHHPHPESAVKQTWNARQAYDLHGRMDALYKIFLSELYQKHATAVKGHPPIVEMCPSKSNNKQ
jgi:hypothetical protein